MKEKKHIVSSVNPLSVAKVSSLLFVIVAAILGVVSYVTYAAMYYISQSSGAGLPDGMNAESFQSLNQIEWGIILSVLILYSLSGFFIGYVGSLVYNMLVPRIGGIEISFKEKN